MEIAYNTEATTNNTPEAQRAVIKPNLDTIALEVGIALRDARLDFPVFITIPNSGEAIATIATPLDPSNDDWTCAMSIVYQIIGKRLGDVRLRGRPLVCAMANARIGAADVVADARNDS
jgi:hypothetical protein